MSTKSSGRRTKHTNKKSSGRAEHTSKKSSGRAEHASRKLCVVFDLDETLIHFLNNNKLSATKWDTLSDDQRNEFQYIKNTKTKNVVLFRPYLIELFAYFNANRDKFQVGLWTYSDRDYCNEIARTISQEFKKRTGEELGEDFFLFKYGEEDILEHDGGDNPKDLNYVYNNFPHLSSFNTFIVDDLYGNIVHEMNRENCIIIPPYAPFSRNKERAALTEESLRIALSDSALDQLKDVCDTVFRDINGCDDEDIDAAKHSKNEAVFSAKRVKRMGLEQMMRKYANKFVNLPALNDVNNIYQTDRFIDVTDQAERYGPKAHGGGRSRRKTRWNKKSNKRCNKTRSNRLKWSGKRKTRKSNKSKRKTRK